MKKTTTPNERIKRQYFIYLKEAKGRNEASIDSVAKGLNRFEIYTRFRDFKQFHVEQAKGFKAQLAKQENARTGDRLSVATLYSTWGALKAFFHYPNAAVHYVGHSNGTYLVAQALRDYPAARFKHIVLVGSVVRADYDWSSFINQKPPRVEHGGMEDNRITVVIQRFSDAPEAVEHAEA